MACLYPGVMALVLCNGTRPHSRCFAERSRGSHQAYQRQGPHKIAAVGDRPVAHQLQQQSGLGHAQQHVHLLLCGSMEPSRWHSTA